LAGQRAVHKTRTDPRGKGTSRDDIIGSSLSVTCCVRHQLGGAFRSLCQRNHSAPAVRGSRARPRSRGTGRPSSGSGTGEGLSPAREGQCTRHREQRRCRGVQGARVTSRLRGPPRGPPLTPVPRPLRCLQGVGGGRSSRTRGGATQPWRQGVGEERPPRCWRTDPRCLRIQATLSFIHSDRIGSPRVWRSDDAPCTRP